MQSHLPQIRRAHLAVSTVTAALLLTRLAPLLHVVTWGIGILGGHTLVTSGDVVHMLGIADAVSTVVVPDGGELILCSCGAGDARRTRPCDLVRGSSGRTPTLWLAFLRPRGLHTGSHTLCAGRTSLHGLCRR